jgi:DedD protein
MDVRVRERLIGALVLVAIVVLFVPAILKGRDPEPIQAPEPATVRRIEMPIGDAAPAPEEQILVPEPQEPDRPPAPAPPPPADPATGANVARTQPVAPPPSAAPPDARAAARAAPPPAVAQSSPASAWAVQLGAFSNKSKAEQLVAELRKRQFAAFVLEYRASGKVLYRVRVGPEQDRARAEATAARLAKEGFEPVVARHP